MVTNRTTDTERPFRGNLPRARLGLAACVALLAAPALAGATAAGHPAPAAGASRPVVAAVTRVHLDPAALAAIGLRVQRLVPSAVAPPPHRLSFVSREAPAFRAARPRALRVEVAGGAARAFAGGPARHRGGFVLAGRGGTFDFAPFALRAAPDRRHAFEVLDASGQALLVAVQPWFDLDLHTGVLRYINADLRLTPAFARRLGNPRLADLTIGSLELHATVGEDAGAVHPTLGEVHAFDPDPCMDFSGDVDVALIDIDAVQQAQAAGSVAGRIVVVPSVTLKNVGTANVPWYTKFSGSFPPHDNDQHPYLVWQMARELDGVLEPLGRNDLKHAFATLNTGCTDPEDACSTPNSHVLGLGCEDPYNFGSNTIVSSQAPRSEVTASTGIWAHCDEPAPNTPSHLDSNADCVQNTPPGETLHTHGMKVAESALGIPGARYFVEAFYVVRDDVNVLNSMGWREVTPAPAMPPTNWTFTPAGPYQQGPVLDAWVDPDQPGPGADSEVVDTGEGLVQVAMRITPLPDGRRRFAYAVQNHDFDRRIDSFRVPLDTSGGLTAIAFADGDGEAANDWTPAVDAMGVTWTAPPATTPPAELDWGTLYAFRFETDEALPSGPVTLGVFEAGSPATLELPVLCDSTGPCFHDGFESGDTSRWTGTAPW
jgi:hypothetical protein